MLEQWCLHGGELSSQSSLEAGSKSSRTLCPSKKWGQFTLLNWSPVT